MRAGWFAVIGFAVLTVACSQQNGAGGMLFVQQLASGSSSDALIGKLSGIKGKFTQYTIPTPAANPYEIALGSNGNYWFTEKNVDYIGEITTKGTFSEFFPVPTSGSEPAGITAGPDDALWFTELIGNNIGRITTTGTITEYKVPTSNACPYRITEGPDKALWFTEYCVGQIGRLVPKSGKIEEYSLAAPTSAPGGIGSGPGGLWFCEEAGQAVGLMTTAGKVTKLLTIANSNPDDVVEGYDGNMWFTDYGNNAIGRILLKESDKIEEKPVPTASSVPLLITQGPDKLLWFTEQVASKIGSIANEGKKITIKEYPIPGPTTGARGIAPGSNSLWFTEPDVDAIGELK